MIFTGLEFQAALKVQLVYCQPLEECQRPRSHLTLMLMEWCTCQPRTKELKRNNKLSYSHLHGGLSKEQIEQMVHEAESDKQKKNLIEVVNTAESAIYDTQKNVDEYKSVEEEISELDNVMINKQRLFVKPQIIFQGLPWYCLNLLTRTDDHRVKDHQVKDHQVTDHYHNLQARHHQLSIPVTHCVILWRSRINC